MNDRITIIYSRQVPGVGPVKASRVLDLGHYGQDCARDAKVAEALNHLRDSVEAHARAIDPFVTKPASKFLTEQTGEGVVEGIKFRELKITPCA